MILVLLGMTPNRSSCRSDRIRMPMMTGRIDKVWFDRVKNKKKDRQEPRGATQPILRSTHYLRFGFRGQMWLNNISVGFRALMAGAKIIIKYNVKGMRCDYREGPAGSGYHGCGVTAGSRIAASWQLSHWIQCTTMAEQRRKKIVIHSIQVLFQ